MGAVLEMKPSRMGSTGVVLVAAIGLLVGCAAVPLAKAALSKVGGGKSPIIAKPAKDSAAITMTLVSRGIKFPIQRLAVKGDVTLWTAADGAQVALREGMMISTRGFGMDLMSADVPSVADLIDENPRHGRVNTVLNGLDTTVRRSYDCVVTPVTDTSGTAGGAPETAYHVLETCQSDAGRIKNEYWIDSGGAVVKSKQWISSGVGYAIFDTAVG